MNTTLSIHLENYNSGSPMGAVLADETEMTDNVLDSEYCDTLDDFVEFAARNKEYINANTNICIIANIDEVSSTNVLHFGNDVAMAIRKAMREGEAYES